MSTSWDPKHLVWYSKKAEVFNAMEASDQATVLLASDIGAAGAKQFGFVPTYDVLASWVVASHELGQPLSLYECIAPTVASRVYFDVDCERSEHPDEFDAWNADKDAFLKGTMLPSLIAFMRTVYGLELESDDFLVSVAHKTDKISFHLSVPWRLQDGATRALFRAHVIEHRTRAELGENDVFRHKGMPDYKVYTKDQNYRMLYCCKQGKHNPLVPLRRDWLAEWPDDAAAQFTLSLAQGDTSDLTPINPIVELRGRARRAQVEAEGTRVQSLREGAPRSLTVGRQPETAKEKACWAHTQSLLDGGGAGTLVASDGTVGPCPSRCEQLINDPGEAVKIQCRPNDRRTCAHGNDCSTNTFYVRYVERGGGRHDVEVVCPGFLHMACSNTSTKIGDLVYNETDVPCEVYTYIDPATGKNGVRPLDHPGAAQTKAGYWEADGGGVIVECSEKGNGKTYRVIKALVKYYAAGCPFSNHSFLFIFHRRLLGREIFRLLLECLVELGFEWYETSINGNRLFICIDSLWKLKGRHFDGIWIDEVPEALKTFGTKVYDVDGAHILDSFHVFHDLVEETKRLLLTSADAGQLEDATFRGIVPEGTPFYWTKSSNLPRQGCEFLVLHAEDNACVVEHLIEALTAGKNIGVFFTERGDCNDIARLLSESLPTKHICVLTGEEGYELLDGMRTNVGKESMLHNLEATGLDANAPNCVCYTAVMGEGCSVNILNHYHQAFVVANNRTADGCQGTQGVHRIRNLADGKVTLTCLKGVVDWELNPGYRQKPDADPEAVEYSAVEDLSVTHGCKSVQATVRLLYKQHASLTDGLYITRKHKRVVNGDDSDESSNSGVDKVVLERRRQPPLETLAQTGARLTTGGRINTVFNAAYARGDDLPTGVTTLSLASNVDMLTDLDPVNVKFMRMAIVVQNRQQNNRSTFVQDFRRLMVGAGYTETIDHLFNSARLNALAKKRREVREERQKAECAALLRAVPYDDVDEFNAVAAKPARSSEETRRMQRTWIDATYGSGVVLTDANVKRLGDKTKQRAFRLGCNLLYELEGLKARRADDTLDEAGELAAQQADARGIVERMKRASRTDTNDPFVTNPQHASAQMDCLLDLLRTMGLSLEGVLSGKWVAQPLGVAQEAQLRQTWRRYHENYSARANGTCQTTGNGGDSQLKLLTTIKSIFRDRLAVRSAADIKNKVPMPTAGQAARYKQWFEATTVHPFNTPLREHILTVFQLQNVDSVVVLETTECGRVRTVRCDASGPLKCPHGIDVAGGEFTVTALPVVDAAGGYTGEYCTTIEFDAIDCTRCKSSTSALSAVPTVVHEEAPPANELSRFEPPSGSHDLVAPKRAADGPGCETPSQGRSKKPRTSDTKTSAESVQPGAEAGDKPLVVDEDGARAIVRQVLESGDLGPVEDLPQVTSCGRCECVVQTTTSHPTTPTRTGPAQSGVRCHQERR